MKFLCLADGEEAGWKALTKAERTEMLAADKVLERRGAFGSAVKPEVTAVTNHGRHLKTTNESFARPPQTLAGFSIVEADRVEDVVRLVAETACARAGGAIEIRPFWDLGADA